MVGWLTASNEQHVRGWDQVTPGVWHRGPAVKPPALPSPAVLQVAGGTVAPAAGIQRQRQSLHQIGLQCRLTVAHDSIRNCADLTKCLTCEAVADHLQLSAGRPTSAGPQPEASTSGQGPSQGPPQIGIIMGSDSDLTTMAAAEEVCYMPNLLFCCQPKVVKIAIVNPTGTTNSESSPIETIIHRDSNNGCS